jgi:hypothetical protein
VGEVESLLQRKESGIGILSELYVIMVVNINNMKRQKGKEWRWSWKGSMMSLVIINSSDSGFVTM